MENLPGGAVFKLETRASQSLAFGPAVDMDHLHGPMGPMGMMIEASPLNMAH